MEILKDLLFIVVGIYCVINGANLLTKGSVALAERFRMPQIIIGLTIVALGTSLPELCVSLMSALNGTADMAVGNVVGSNIFNTLLIVGVAALIMPIAVSRATVRRDMVFALFASVLLLGLCLNGDLLRWEGLLLLALFLAYLAVTIRQSTRENKEEEMEKEPVSWLKTLSWLVAGLILLPLGSYVFVGHASNLALALGMSEAVVGLTIVAGGTSLPELATTIVAARKGESGIAIGNVLGSNVLNILFILGLTSLISPLYISGITMVDYGMLIASMAVFLLFSWTRFKIERWEGIVLTAMFVGYLSWLLYNI